ncbi:calcium-binding protein KRP1-like [Populus alba x Populus x berolinensis]|nr:calcium-binding protein KRP1-like [Populus alba x Populus x berolinensis]
MTCPLAGSHGLSFFEIPIPYLYMNQSHEPKHPSLKYPQTKFLFSSVYSLHLSLYRKMAAASNFEDFLPLMATKLGGDGLIGELCNGFNLLVDSEKGVITFDSLKKNSTLLGLQDLSDDDLRCMLREGDFDGDGALNQMEFCVLMFRLSPELMEESQSLLEEALLQEFKHDC